MQNPASSIQYLNPNNAVPKGIPMGQIRWVLTGCLSSIPHHPGLN